MKYYYYHFHFIYEEIWSKYVSQAHKNIACMCAKLIQSCPTFWDAMDCNPPGSSVHGFSRQEYWSWLLCPPPGDLPTQGSNPSLLCLLHWQVGSLPLVPSGKPIKTVAAVKTQSFPELNFFNVYHIQPFCNAQDVKSVSSSLIGRIMHNFSFFFMVYSLNFL